MAFPKEIQYTVSDQPSGYSVIFLRQQGKIPQALYIPTPDVQKTLDAILKPEVPAPPQISKFSLRRTA